MDAHARLPTLFLSHGSPMLAVEDSPAGRFLDRLGDELPWPRAVVIASAHFETTRPTLGGHPRPRTVHDFRGFPESLYEIRYPAPGAPDLAEQIGNRLGDAGWDPVVSDHNGLDHGVWVPLRRIYPQGDVPVVPISVMPNQSAARHFELGKALASLRGEGVLVIGSGGFVHNLGELDWRQPDAPPPTWAREFSAWMHDRIAARDWPSLLQWEQLAPHAGRAHPTAEHLLPLFVALGAAGNAPEPRVIHQSTQLGSLALDAIAFD